MPDQTSQEARADYNALLEALMPFAEEMLKKHGEFYPFAAAVNLSGEVIAYSNDEEREMPPSEEVIASLIKTFQAEALDGRIRAAGICFDGRIVQDGKKVDAIIVDLEHVSGDACKTYAPYRKNLFGKYSIGDLAASRTKPQIFLKV